MLDSYEINNTKEYDNMLKSHYSEDNKRETLMVNHISLGNRCIFSKKDEIKNLLVQTLPSGITIDRLVVKGFYPGEYIYFKYF